MSIRAIFVDLDGTLLGRSQVAVSRENMAALQEALAKGIHVIPCTGRVYTMLPPQLLTQQGLRYFITSHGARAYDRDTGESIYEDLIPPEEAAKLLSFLEGKGLYNEIAAQAVIWLEKAVTEPLPMALVPEHHVWYIRDHCYTAVDSPGAHFLRHGIGVEKMNIYSIPENLRQPVFEFVKAAGYIGYALPGAGANLEILRPGQDKLRAVGVVLERLGVTMEETMAIGDTEPDMEMIRACGIGVAMGNAPDKVKAVADHVTDLNTENGVAKAIRKFVL